MTSFNYHAQERELRRRAKRPLVGHEVTERQSRAFDFRTPGRGFAYAFSLTWTPGSLALAGDCGEITLCNHSLGDLIGALEWAQHGDINYLLEKTSRRKAYDADATAAQIVEIAIEAAKWPQAARHREHRQWRSERPDPYAWEEPWTYDGFFWHDNGPTEWECWRDDRPAALAFEPDRVFRKAHFSWEQDRVESVMVPPEGWQVWECLRERFASHLDQSAIFKSRWRRYIAKDLRAELRNLSGEKAAELCSELGLDDYYGSQSWDARSIQQIECVRHGAWLALLHLQPERVYQWAPAPWRPDPDVFPRAAAETDARHAAERAAYRRKVAA